MGCIKAHPLFENRGKLLMGYESYINRSEVVSSVILGEGATHLKIVAQIDQEACVF